MNREILLKNKNQFIAWGGACVALMAMGLILGGQIQGLKKKNELNLQRLNEVLPGFNERSVTLLKKEISSTMDYIGDLSGVFDTKGRWMNKDYDLSIHFVEQLAKINRQLKEKASGKQVNLAQLGFQEQLPSQEDALYLLSQLDSLKKVLDLGMEYGIDFNSINPQAVGKPKEPAVALKGVKKAVPQEEKAGQILEAGFRNLLSSIQVKTTAEPLVQFLIQMNELTPKVFLSSFSLKKEGSYLNINIILNSLILEKEDLGIKSQEGAPPFVLKEERASLETLRASNPFIVPQAKGAVLSFEETKSQEEQIPQKQKERFFFRGKALLQSREVAVIEDSLNQETHFLARGERIGKFVLAEFSDSQAVLKDILENKELILELEGGKE